jgi:WD40 repeat protein
LRIEAGAHLSLVTRVSTDAQGRWIVSASEDKTARVWDAATGRLLSVLRPPVGPESVGALYAAALSPDGKQVALGGNAAFDGKSHSLYLFDRSTGRLPPKSTLSGLEAPLTQLAWSKDSQFVAVGLRQSGLRVFQRNLGFVGSDPEYNEAIYGADFSADGRLVTCSLDGSVRFYRVDKKAVWSRTARKQLASGGRPYCGRVFSGWEPDSRRLPGCRAHRRARRRFADTGALRNARRVRKVTSAALPGPADGQLADRCRNSQGERALSPSSAFGDAGRGPASRTRWVQQHRDGTGASSGWFYRGDRRALVGQL